MSKLRLVVTAAFLVFLVGCPTEGDDLRRSRAEAVDPPQPEMVENEYACPNLRKWRGDLDTPQYLKTTLTNADEDAHRQKLLRDYEKDHEGTLIPCRNKLTGEGARGNCSICTEMMNNPKYLEQVYDQDKAGANHDYATRPIQLTDTQKLTTKFEARLKWDKADYETEPAAQEKSFRDWLATRGAEQAFIDKQVELEKGKGSWATATYPKTVLKYGLPPLAEPFVRCPNKDCDKRTTTSVGMQDSKCWNCGIYFVVMARDTRMSESEPLETLCPFCKSPVDPTSNFCTKCNKFHRTADRDGPCWRCGGTHICPECNGSGRGTAPIFNGNEDCFLCGGKLPGGTNGMCPECDSRGFTTYDGALPVTYNAAKRVNDDWKLSKNAPMKPEKEEGDK